MFYLFFFRGIVLFAVCKIVVSMVAGTGRRPWNMFKRKLQKWRLRPFYFPSHSERFNWVFAFFWPHACNDDMHRGDTSPFACTDWLVSTFTVRLCGTQLYLQTLTLHQRPMLWGNRLIILNETCPQFLVGTCCAIKISMANHVVDVAQNVHQRVSNAEFFGPTCL